MRACMPSMRDKCAYIVAFGSTFPSVRGSCSLHICARANRFRILIPLQIDRSSVTLITSFFFLARSPSMVYAPRERLARRNFYGAPVGHPMAVPSSNVEVARATWAAARVCARRRELPSRFILFCLTLWDVKESEKERERGGKNKGKAP